MAVTYSLFVGDLIEVQIVGKMHNQRTRNVFHFAYGGNPSTDGEADLETFAGAFNVQVGASIRAFASLEWMHEYVTIQKIKAIRYRPVPLLVNLPGDVEGSACPTGVAAVISRSAVTAGRQFQCRNYIPGVPVVNEDDSELDDDGYALLDTIGAATAAALLIDGGAKVLNPITSGNVAVPVPIAYTVQQYFPRRELHYQRRRAVGHGE